MVQTQSDEFYGTTQMNWLTKLNSKRADSYGECSKLIWACKNADIALDTVHAFCKQSEKYNENWVNDMYNKAKTGEQCYNLDSIRKWVACDNKKPVENSIINQLLNEIFEKQTWHTSKCENSIIITSEKYTIRASINGLFENNTKIGHPKSTQLLYIFGLFDLALLKKMSKITLTECDTAHIIVKNMKQTLFKCVSLKGEMYYTKKHKWVKCNTVKLKQYIIDDFFKNVTAMRYCFPEEIKKVKKWTSFLKNKLCNTKN